MDTKDAYIRPTRPHSEEVVQLSVMDQLMPRRHMCYLLCFRHSPTATPQTAIRHLQAGLAAVLTEMPQFAGELQQRSSSKNELVLVLSPESEVLFRISERMHQAEYDSLINGMTKGPLVADDQLAIPAAELQTENGGTRAFVVQATVVSGGLLLATSIHHSLADAKATEVLFESWAKHTAEQSHGRKSVIQRAHDDTTARWRLSYGPINAQMDSFLELYGPKATYQAPTIAEQVVASTWTLSPQKMQELKDSVSVSDVQVSTSDLVCALIARHVYKARKQYESTSTPWPESVLLYVTSDMRSRLEPPLAKNYLGNASVAVPVAVDLSNLLENPVSVALSTLAANIKTAIDKFDTLALRSRLGFYKAQPFYGSVVPKFEYYPGPNMLITDSSSMSFYSMNWGSVLHTMDYFRSVGQTHSVGQCALNPKRRDGTIEFQMRHDLRVVEAMRDDKGFSGFFELAGYY